MQQELSLSTFVSVPSGLRRGEVAELVTRTWKTVIIVGMLLLTIAGIIAALFNLPVVSGYVPR